MLSWNKIPQTARQSLTKYINLSAFCSFHKLVEYLALLANEILEC